jgi:hypothetical protein
MTTRQADRLIKSGEKVKVHNATFNETFEIVIVSRDRWNIETKDGGLFDRKGLEIVK